MNKLITTWERIVGRNLISYCDLEANEGKNTLTDDNGGFVSIITINGMARLFAASDLEQLSERLSISLGQIMSNEAYQIEFHREYEPFDEHAVGGDIQRFLNGMRQTARSLGYDAEWLLQDYADHFTSKGQNQRTWLVVRTNPARLDAHQKEELALQASREINTRTFKAGDVLIPRAGDPSAMSPINRSRPAVVIHEGTVRAIHDALLKEGMDLQMMSAHDAIAVIRRMMAPAATPSNYRPWMLGDRMHVRVPRNGGRLAPADILPIPLRDQIFAEDIDLDGELLTIGDRAYRAVLVEVPGDWEAFGLLQKTLQQSERTMPWRVSMRLRGNGLKESGIRQWLVGLMRFVPGPNAEIATALKDLKERVAGNQPAVSWSLDAVTWAPKNNPDLLARRHTALVRGLESWGGVKVKGRSGNTLDSKTATVPGLRRNSPSVYSIQPLTDVLLATPLTDSASPWRGQLANVAYQTTSGAFWPARFPSPQQKAFVKFIYAGMGGGKSVTLGAEAIGLLFDPSLSSLPVIGSIDFGPSSLGAIRTAQAFLPPHLRHTARYHRLKNNAATDGLNCFDLPLGFNAPLSGQRDFLVGFLAMLVQSPGHTLPAGIEGLLSRVIDIAYEKRSNPVTATRYTRGVSPDIDEAIEKLSISIDAQTSWNEIRDELFAQKNIRLARLAQTWAVPTLPYIASMCRLETIANGIGKQLVNGTPMSDYVYEAIQTAVTMYPLLADRSKLDFSDCRYLSLDLDEVCPRGDALADKQTAVMLLVAMRTVTSLMSYSIDDVRLCPEGYRSWFESWVKSLNRVPRRFTVDEYHRTGIGNTAEARSASPARKASMVLIRQGRKDNVEVCVASQLLEDADEDMLSLTTSIICMGAPEDANLAANVARRFSLGPAGEELLLTQLNRPGRFLAIYQLKSRPTTTALLEVPVPGRLLWALSSSKSEDNVRRAVVSELGDARGLKALAAFFPSPALVDDEIKRRIEQRVQRGSTDNYDVTDDIVKDVLKRAQTME